MPYEDPLKEYFKQNPEKKLKLFKIYTKVLIIIPFLMAFGVIIYLSLYGISFKNLIKIFLLNLFLTLFLKKNYMKEL